MNEIVLLSILIIVGTLKIIECGKCGQNRDTNSGFRIVGGDAAIENQVPWQASLQINGQHCCGGSIIGPSWILSAAHCYDEYWGKRGFTFTVVVGTLIQNLGSRVGQVARVKNVIIHPKWNRKTAFGDIMLIQLAAPLKFYNKGNGAKGSTAVGPICLPAVNSNEWNYEGEAKISGFGLTKHGGKSSSNILLFIKESVLPDNVCDHFYGRSKFKYDKKSMVCYGNLAGGKGTCQGDSGGPLVVNIKNDHWMQKGVVSFGSICGGRNSPSVFTKVHHYRQWIYDNCKI